MNAVNTAFDNGYAAGRDDARRRAELVVSERDAEIARLRAEVEQYKADAAVITRLRAELAGVDARLPDDRYAGSKDWRHSDRLGKIEWLHAMYESRDREADLWLGRASEALETEARLRAEVEGLKAAVDFAVRRAIEDCKNASGQRRAIDLYVNGNDIVNAALEQAALRGGEG